MKLSVTQQATTKYDRGTTVAILRDIETLCNLLSDEKIDAYNRAYTAAPTTGTHKKADFVRNSSPSEAGSAGSKYVIFGWICVTSGTPGTWKECRFLTGN